MRHGRLRAIISMLAAVAAFSGMDALLKFFSATYPPMEVAVLRGAAALPFLLVPVLLFGRWQDLKPQRFAMHLARGALAVLVLGTFIYAVRALSLANAYAVFLSAPLIMTALSVPILKERTDRAGWLAISMGLLGVVIMLRPSATFWRSLTERRAARRSSADESPTVSATFCTSRSTSSAGGRGLRTRRPNPRFSRTVMCVKIA